MKRQKQWEPMIFRPTLPEHWDCFEQRGISRYSETTFFRWGKDHHNGEPRRFFIVFNEFDPDHYNNENLSFRYTVRGGNDVKPGMTLRYFTKLKDAENYVIYLAESTNKWIEEITSEKHIAAYNKRIEELKKLSRRKSYDEV